jgi:KDO2-lipid IV(A) lauroyltransferase
VVIRNLNLSFPDKTQTEKDIIAKGFYKHFVDSFFEAIRLLHMKKKDLLKHFWYKNPALLEEIYKQGKSIILLLPHYGNWEWLANLELVSPYHFLAIYKPLSNKCFDSLYIRIRERFGGETVRMKNAYRKIITYQNDHKQIISFFLYDQRPIRTELNNWITFFNQDTPVLLGAEKIARQTDQTVLFLKMHKIKRGRYENEFILISDQPSKTKEMEITKKYYKTLEELLREDPMPWLWSHDRWKFTR